MKRTRHADQPSSSRSSASVYQPSSMVTVYLDCLRMTRSKVLINCSWGKVVNRLKCKRPMCYMLNSEDLLKVHLFEDVGHLVPVAFVPMVFQPLGYVELLSPHLWFDHPGYPCFGRCMQLLLAGGSGLQACQKDWAASYVQPTASVALPILACWYLPQSLRVIQAGRGCNGPFDTLLLRCILCSMLLSLARHDGQVGRFRCQRRCRRRPVIFTLMNLMYVRKHCNTDSRQWHLSCTHLVIRGLVAR